MERRRYGDTPPDHQRHCMQRRRITHMHKHTPRRAYTPRFTIWPLGRAPRFVGSYVTQPSRCVRVSVCLGSWDPGSRDADVEGERRSGQRCATVLGFGRCGARKYYYHLGCVLNAAAAAAAAPAAADVVLYDPHTRARAQNSPHHTRCACAAEGGAELARLSL